MLLHGAFDLDQRVLKMRNSTQGCAFSVCDRCTPTFGTQTPNIEIKMLAHELDFQVRTPNNSNTYKFNTTILIITKFLLGITTIIRHLWVARWLPSTNPRWRTVAILNFAKCKIAFKF